MKFNHFLTNIYKIKSAILGGLNAQLKMISVERKQLNLDKIVAKNPKEAAVLILFYANKNQETCFLLTKRASYNGTHSAQISFPGGKTAKEDNSLLQTALRETFEEVNICINDVIFLKELTKTYIPPSNFWVYPFLGFMHKLPIFTKNYEVEELIEVKLSELLANKNQSAIIIETSYLKKVEVPCFKFGEHIVWGATAMILSEVKELFKNINI
ncbi:MAG: CoA pyrophosphatase [Flavobacteriaceae bacterium]|nr:CoA pyrophosphatase [Flavobacteriaceae bacterium]